MFISTLIGLVIAVMTLGQVSTSVSQTIFTRNVESSLSREEMLVQQVQQYRTNEGAYPATVADLVSKGYWLAGDNNNGFGGSYTFTVDVAKGQVAISTTIADANRRTQYLGSFRHTFKPVDAGSGVVTTTFVMPSKGSSGIPSPNAGVPVSSTAPSASSNTYWYDNSSGSAVLKVSNGSTWLTANVGASGLAAPSNSNMVSNVASLPFAASVGDVRYVLDSANNTLSTYVYYNSGWVYSGAGVTQKSIVLQPGGYRTWADGTVASSCKAYLNGSANYVYVGSIGDGVYRIDVDGAGSLAPTDVVCDMTTSGGGWTIIQRRVNGAVDFYRTYAEYANGFGTAATEYWIGNDRIAALTAAGTTLRFDMSRTNGQSAYEEYSYFNIASAANYYRLTVSGPSGTAGDSFSGVSGYRFTTKDVDLDDVAGGNCAVVYRGAWWYSSCHQSNLNGAYLNGPHASYADGVEWNTWTGYYESLAKTEMKVR